MEVALLGHGVVGSGVDKILSQLDQYHVGKILVHYEKECTDERCTLKAEEILQDPRIDIVIECMGGVEPAFSYCKEAMEQGKSVVTSNKAMVARHMLELCETARKYNVGFSFEAAVGGGIPWLAALRRVRRIDTVSSVYGIFNGTSNYILSRMTTDRIDFDAALNGAQQAGFAEANPTDDISGMDIANKLCLSAFVGMDAFVDVTRIPRLSLSGVSLSDVRWAGELGYCLKYLGVCKRKENGLVMEVLPVLLGDDEVLAHVNGNDNGLTCESDTLGRSMYIGQGAGSLPTAHAVVQDVLDLPGQIDSGKPAAILADDRQAVFFGHGGAGEYADRRFGDCFMSKPMTLAQASRLQQEQGLFLAEVWHD